ncbi:hypothetical protein DSO57_1037114 [Entomophthora muscae]|nr:hypothetical protein DSO57_1037114 [Entomophthora muscae]
METLLLFWGGIHFLRWAIKYYGGMRRFRIRSFTNGDGSSYHTFTMDLMSINYSTSALNSIVTWIGVQFRSFWMVWFTFGVVYAVIASFLGVVLLIYSIVLWVAFYTNSQAGMSRYIVFGQLLSKYLGGIEGANSHGASPMLNLMIPGITLPLSHLPLYVTSFLIAGILHELGHGIAGAAHGVPLMRFGVNLSLFYPSAYTELEHDKLNRISPVSQLRIISGGVWHNLILAIVAGAIYNSHTLSSALLSTPLYMPSPCNAPIVKWIRPGSPLAKEIGPGSTILSLNDQALTNVANWKTLLSPKNMSTSPTRGHCITKGQLKVSQKDCCSPSSQSQATSGDRGCFMDISDKTSLGCLYTNSVMFNPKCSLEQACGEGSADMASCVALKEPAEDTETWSLIGFVNNQLQTNDACLNPSPMIYYGKRSTLENSVHLEMRVPRFKWIPMLLPTMLDDLFMYIQAFSFALAIFNIIPVFYLDGQHFLTNLIKIIRNKVSNKTTDAYSLVEAGWYNDPTTIQYKYSRRDGWALAEKAILIGSTALLVVATLISFVNLLL